MSLGMCGVWFGFGGVVGAVEFVCTALSRPGSGCVGLGYRLDWVERLGGCGPRPLSDSFSMSIDSRPIEVYVNITMWSSLFQRKVLLLGDIHWVHVITL